MSQLKNGPGAFGVPSTEIWTETPDGVNRVYADNEQRNSLYDARFVSADYNGAGYGAFRGEQYTDMPAPFDTDELYTGATTGASSKKPLGRQR